MDKRDDRYRKLALAIVAMFEKELRKRPGRPSLANIPCETPKTVLSFGFCVMMNEQKIDDRTFNSALMTVAEDKKGCLTK